MNLAGGCWGGGRFSESGVAWEQPPRSSCFHCPGVFSASVCSKERKQFNDNNTEKLRSFRKKYKKNLTYVKFNLIYFYTSSCQFKEQQQSGHLCLISSIRRRWSREHGFWTEAEHVARSRSPLLRSGPSVHTGCGGAGTRMEGSLVS